MADFDKLKEHGFDTDEGISYCAEDPEFYEEMLGEFAAEGENNLKRLEQYFDESDWENYRIVSHSIKNTSKMIGAGEFSEHAHEMELAAKDEDEAKIRESHDIFLAEYVSKLRVIKEAL